MRFQIKRLFFSFPDLHNFPSFYPAYYSTLSRNWQWKRIVVLYQPTATHCRFSVVSFVGRGFVVNSLYCKLERRLQADSYFLSSMKHGKMSPNHLEDFLDIDFSSTPVMLRTLSKQKQKELLSFQFILMINDFEKPLK